MAFSNKKYNIALKNHSFSKIDPSWIVKEHIDEPDGVHPEEDSADKICDREYYDEQGRLRRTERCVFSGSDMVITYEGECFYHDDYVICISRDILDDKIQEERLRLDPDGQFADAYNASLMPITQPDWNDLKSFQPIDPKWEKRENVWSIEKYCFFETAIDCWGQKCPWSDEDSDEVSNDECFTIRDEDYFDGKGRKVATEQYLRGQEELLFYKSEYFYKDDLVECRFWDNEIKKIVTTSLSLKPDGTIDYGEDDNWTPRPIIAACEPDLRWTKEERLNSKMAQTKGFAILEISFYDWARNLKRYEEWQQYPNGEKILVREKIFEDRDGKDWFWENYGGSFTSGYLNYYDYIIDNEELTDY